MRLSKIALAVLSVLFSCSNIFAQSPTIAERLGHPRDSKLLIVHADDLAVAHSEDFASFDALDKGAATSASIMVPCPWLTEVADYAKGHPEADLGLHLTLTSEWATYRWGPVSSKDTVPSLLDSNGYLWPETEPGKQHIKAEDAEREIRAQIEKAMSVGIHPTHLDSHMGMLFERPDLFAVYVKVAREYKLPFLAYLESNTPKELAALLSPNDVLINGVVMAYPEVPVSGWKDFYLSTIKNLKPGVTEIIVHLGRDDSELQAVTVNHPDYGAAWRQRDYDVVTSPEFKKAIDDNKVILVRWRDLKKLVR